MTRRRLEIRAARRFEREMDRLGPQLQQLLTGAVHDFVRGYRSDPTTIAREYDRVSTTVPGIGGDLLELDLSGKDRLVAHWSTGVLTLLAVGGHSTVPRYAARSSELIRQDVASAVPADPGFLPEHWVGQKGLSLESENGVKWDEFPDEDSRDWLYVLSADQRAVVSRAKKLLDRASLLNQARVFVVGGPGTGKTSVLLVLLHELTRKGLRVGIEMSNALAEFAEAAGVSVQPFRPRKRDVTGGPDYTGLDVLLVDDPRYAGTVQAAMDNSFGKTRLIVVGFDPSQIEGDLNDEGLERLITANGVSLQRLRECYRQKSVVGAAAKLKMDQVAASSPFRADYKVERFRSEHTRINEMSNDLRFVNRGGMVREKAGATMADIRAAAKAIGTRRRWGLSRPPVLVVTDDGAAMPDLSWTSLLGDREFARLTLEDIGQAKGLEYQWAILVVRESLFKELSAGFTGSSQRVYENLRLLRIPFTRARDGVFTFAFDDRATYPGIDPFSVR